MSRILIVDDEELARQRMKLLLGEVGFPVAAIDEAPDGKKALERVRSRKPDLILLDIQMPVLDGFDVVDLLGSDRPAVIFVTAYDEYALKAFEVHAVDYLLKPVRKERLAEALSRVVEIDWRKTPAGQASDSRDTMNRAIDELLEFHRRNRISQLRRIPVNYKQEIRFIDYEQICYFEADGKLTRVHTTRGEKYHTDFSLSDLERRLRDQPFLRIHRSFIANLDLVKKLEPWFKGGYRLTMKNGTELDVARRRVANLKDRLGIT